MASLRGLQVFYKKTAAPLIIGEHDGAHQRRRVKVVGWCVYGVIFTIAYFVINVAEAANEREAYGAGALYFQSPEGLRSEALTLNTDIEMDVNGVINRVSLKQVFKNTGDAWQQGVYVFPLPEDSAVDQLTVRVGGRVIKGQIQLKEVAEKKYRAALDAGKKASVVHQNRPNLFTTKIANIGPQEEVSIEIGYLQKVQLEGDRFSIRFPLTVTPRFRPQSQWRGDEGTVGLDSLSFFKGGGNDESLGHQVSISMRLNAGFAISQITSSSHNIVIENNLGAGRVGIGQAAQAAPVFNIAFEEGHVSMDRDFVLEWQPLVEPSPRLSFFNEQWGDEYYGLLMLTPGELQSMTESAVGDLSESSALTSREVIFVMDTSGSMGGASIRQAKAALDYAMSRLTEQDLFNIVEFNTSASRLFKQSKYADLENITAAKRFANALRSNGGTNIEEALNLMFSSSVNEDVPGRQRQFVFITDGSVSNESRLFSLISRYIQQSRLFTVGIGSAPNSYFMRKAAEFGRGSFTQIASVAEVEQKMASLFKKIESPQLVDIKVFAESNVDIEIFPKHIPDLYSDEPLVISMKSGRPFENVWLQGRVNRQPWQEQVHFTAENHPGVAALFGRSKIESLEDERHVSGDKEKYAQAIKSTALFYKLVSRYTSLIAVERSVSRRPYEALNKTHIKNKLPQGTSLLPSGQLPPTPLIAMGYPRTASDGLRHLHRSLLFLGAALLLLLLTRWMNKKSVSTL